jgi:hypothetical protein
MANGKSGKGLRGLLVLTALVIGLLTAWGALVRSTGSGLGCPDWPLCHGRLFPPMEDLAAWLEWIHRLLAASATPLLFLSALLVWRRERQPALYRPLFWALGLVFGQALLGGLTVILELHPTIGRAPGHGPQHPRPHPRGRHSRLRPMGGASSSSRSRGDPACGRSGARHWDGRTSVVCPDAGGGHGDGERRLLGVFLLALL